MNDIFGPEYIPKLRDAIAHLESEAKQLLLDNGGVFKPGSQAETEHSTYTKPEAVYNASAIGVPLIEMGADHLSVFAKILVEPVEGMAAWTCVRSMLESCGLATWLLDPSVDAAARVSRVFAIRYQSVEEQLKFARASKHSTDIDGLKARLDSIEQDANSLVFPTILDRKKKKRIGIAERMPSATELIKRTIDEETMYRMLSAVANGHHWAIRQLCYVVSEADDELVGGTQTRAFKKQVRVDRMAVLGSCAIRAFLRPVWNQCRYFGWNQLKFEELFEDVADRIHIQMNRRFWRSYPAAEMTE